MLYEVVFVEGVGDPVHRLQHQTILELMQALGCAMRTAVTLLVERESARRLAALVS